MTPEQTLHLIKKAQGILLYDRANPEVGMGMFTETAVDAAIEEMIHEAAIYHSVITVTSLEREKVIADVSTWRKRNNI